jgi:SAM-dependent methyltransferase
MTALSTVSAVVAEPSWHPVHNQLADLAQPMPGEVLLDLGCGPGGTLAAVAARVSGVRLIGVDLHAARLAEALGRVGPNSAVMVRADLTGPLPLRDGSVDVVVCHNVMELLPDPMSLFVNAARVLRPGGRAVLSHTDFASLIVHGADPQLTGRIVGAYAQVAQPWMNHIDPCAARRLPGLAGRAGLVLDSIDGHVLADHRVAGDGRQRLAEIAAVVRGHVRRGLVDLADSDVDDWWDQLAHADDRGEFCFVETALITLAHRPG